MTQGYLKRLDVGYPQAPNPRGIYGVKLIEATTLDALEIAVNLYLFALPDTDRKWTPSLIDTEFWYYELSSGPIPRERYVMKITIFAAGTIATPPT